MDNNQRIRPSRQNTKDDMELKPATAKADNMDSCDRQEQDRISEGLSYSVPMAPLAPTPDLGLGTYVGKFVQLHLRNGSVIRGDMVRPQWDLVRLENVERTWKGYRLTADWGALRDDTVAEIYPGNAQVEKIE
jgi:hypothetical protein